MPPMRLKSTLFAVLLAVVQLLTIQPAAALEVQGIRFGVHPDKTRMVVDLSQISDFRTFVLGDPYRMVIDLPDFTWQAQTIEQTANAGISNIRHGRLQPGISRIVLDLENPATIRSAFILPANDTKPNRLVVDFSNTTPAQFVAKKGAIRGTLSEHETVISNKIKPYRTASLGTISPPPPKPATKVIKPLVIIDPGHGGQDPGAIGANGVYEKHIALKIARELRDQLKATGRYRVLMTRDTDVFIKLRDRVKFARKHEGDLFISIHADSLPRSNARGASVYTLSEKASDAQTARLAARENRADLIAGIDLNVEDKEVANILVDLAMRDTMNQSKFFANTLVESFQSKNVRVLENPHRYAGFAVLKAVDIPSVLIEAGFMSNIHEARLLNTSKHRERIAAALKSGIDQYFKQVQKNERI